MAPSAAALDRHSMPGGDIKAPRHRVKAARGAENGLVSCGPPRARACRRRRDQARSYTHSIAYSLVCSRELCYVICYVTLLRHETALSLQQPRGPTAEALCRHALSLRSLFSTFHRG